MPKFAARLSTIVAAGLILFQLALVMLVSSVIVARGQPQGE